MSGKSVFSVNRDAFAGAFFVLFGVLFGIYSLSYRMGTMLQMGPGFLPLVLSALLVLLGLTVLVRAIIVRNIDRVSFALRPMLTISLSVIVFALSIDKLGLFVSVFFLVVLSGLAIQPFRAGRLVGLGVALALICSLLFVHFLNLPFRIIPNLGS
jgi:hypothetical protein